MNVTFGDIKNTGDKDLWPFFYYLYEIKYE